MSENLTPISINLKIPPPAENLKNISTINIVPNFEKQLKTLTLTPNEREIKTYLNIANPTRYKPRVVFNKAPVQIPLTEDHVAASVSAEEGDEVVQDIRHRVKKEYQRPRPVSEADISHKLHLTQQQLQILHQKQVYIPDEPVVQARSKGNHETLLLKELLQLSIKREKIEKALAATGYTNSMKAINWLMKHSKDPYLSQDPKIPVREYVLVLSPIGRLAEEIGKFIQVSKVKCSSETIFNKAIPYMKLTSFFKLPDTDTLALHKAFDLLFKLQSSSDNADQADKKKTLLNEINIDLHVSSQMVLLYPDIDSENSIKNLVHSFNKLYSKMVQSEYEITPYQKQLHLTLAYNFSSEQKKILEDNAKKHIDLEGPSDWEMRMYSRDVRAESKFTYRVISAYKSKAYGELSLKENDYMYASAVTTKDNFIKGISLTHGDNGFFPIKNVERTNETETWTLHKSSLCISQSNTNQQETNYQSQFDKLINEKANKRLSQPAATSNGNQVAPALVASENSFMQGRFLNSPERSQQTPTLVRFFFARHGERIDLTFGASWLDQAFDKQGKYRRTNLNMPMRLPIRNSKRDFIGDSPLTEVGKFQAKLTGEALGGESYRIHYCYASPALRCIQTAQQILQAQGLDKIVKIRIEPSIFEFLGWYEKGLPKFLSTDALIEFGFNIDTSYKSLLPIDRLQIDENYTDYYQRSFNVTKFLTSLHQSEGANILCVGHAGTLEVCTRQMSGMPIRSYSEFNQTIRKVPYLGLCLLKREANSTSFEIQNAVIPPIGHTANFNFDSNNLTAIIPPKSNTLKNK